MDARDLGDGVLLRRVAPADAAEVFALVDGNRTHLEPWMPWVDGTRTIDDTRLWIDSTRAGVHCVIVERARIAGVVGADEIDPDGTEIGYWLAESAQGRGLMTRAARALIEHITRDLGVRRVTLRCAPENTRSRAVAERLGFREIARIPGGEPHGRGSVVYELAQPDVTGSRA